MRQIQHFLLFKYAISLIYFEAGCYYFYGKEGGPWQKWIAEMR
jgi:hypothetical protein